MHHRLFFALVLLLALGGLSWSSPAGASIYMFVDGQNQGVIEGDATFPPEFDTIALTRFEQEITTAIDQATGQPVSAPLYRPVKVIMEQDRSSVPLLQAYLSNETLREVRLTVYLPGAGGSLQKAYTVELSNALIVGWREVGELNETPVQEWDLVFETIVWQDELNGTVTQGSWTSGPSAIGDPFGRDKSDLALMEPMPNPSTDRTVLRFNLPISTQADLSVFDLRGRRVRNIFTGATPADRVAVTWDGTDDFGEEVGRGVYLIKLAWPEGVTTRRVALVR